MSENSKIEISVLEYLQGMEQRLLADRKQRHENHEAVTKANFKTFGVKIDSVKDHSNSTRWIIGGLIGLLALVIAGTGLVLSIIQLSN